MLTVSEAILVVLLVLLVGPAPAQSPPPAIPPAAPCAADPLTPTPISTRLAVTVNPATIWQPRGGEVIVKLEGDKNLLAGTRITACWRWGEGPVAGSAGQGAFARGLVHNRPSDIEGVVNFGVMVPYLPSAPELFPARVLPGGRLWSDGFGTVPVAELRLILDNGTDPPEAVVVHIGITNPWCALIIAMTLTGFSLLMLFRFAESRSAAGKGPIRLITGADNMASLSALQILLWSATVAFSAIYVMCLTGNLINLTPGTLVLLGISGATTLATVLQPARYAEAIGQRAAAARQEVTQSPLPKAALTAQAGPDRRTRGPGAASDQPPATLVGPDRPGGRRGRRRHEPRPDAALHPGDVAVRAAERAENLCDSGHPGILPGADRHQQRRVYRRPRRNDPATGGH